MLVGSVVLSCSTTENDKRKNLDSDKSKPSHSEIKTDSASINKRSIADFTIGDQLAISNIAQKKDTIFYDEDGSSWPGYIISTSKKSEIIVEVQKDSNLIIGLMTTSSDYYTSRGVHVGMTFNDFFNKVGEYIEIQMEYSGLMFYDPNLQGYYIFNELLEIDNGVINDADLIDFVNTKNIKFLKNLDLKNIKLDMIRLIYIQ